MGKVAPPITKYVVYAQFEADGIVEKPDVIGAIFGQTEGLLGPELDLRELQRSGRIGRIDVNLEHKNGKTYGKIILPSSMDMAETSLIAATLETIQRIGPASARVKVIKVEDVREEKRKYVIERAKDLLRQLIQNSMPDHHEITEKIRQEVRSMELIEYGPEKLPAGPGVYDSEEIIIVEGRADVINLLRHGFKNVIGMNGTKIPKTIIELAKRKTTTVFVDGDRGGDLILKELLEKVDVDFVAKAPEGKEVEELTKKEILKALRSKIPAEVLKSEKGQKKVKIDEDLLKVFKRYSKEIFGRKKAVLLDENLEVIAEVPANEVGRIIDETKAYAIIMDAPVNDELIRKFEENDVEYVVCSKKLGEGMKTKVIERNEI